MWHWKLWFCHTQLARYIGLPNRQGSPGGCFMAKPGRCSGNSHGMIGTWRQGIVELHAPIEESALHCIEEDLVMKPRTGKQLLEHSGGKWPGWQNWVSLEDCKRFGKPSSKMHNLKAAMIRYCIYIYICSFPCDRRVYSVNSLFCLACIRCWFQ